MGIILCVNVFYQISPRLFKPLKHIMRKIYSITVYLLAVFNISSAQEIYFPSETSPQLFSPIIEEYKRRRFEEKLKLDSERIEFDLKRAKSQSEIQRLFRADGTKSDDLTAVSIEEGLEKLRKALNPETPTLRSLAAPEMLSNASDHLTIDTTADFVSQPLQTGQSYVQPTTKLVPINQNNFSRFANSPCFQTFGYIPDDPGLEERYRRCEESKRNDQIAKVSLWAAIIAGLLGAAWFAFKAFNPSKGSKARALR